MNSSIFKGTGVAIVTPFNVDGSVDFNALKELINFQINSDIDFIVALGTTSEAATLTSEEKDTIVDFIIDVNNGKVPIVVGCGGNNTAGVIRELDKYNSNKNIDGILSVAPYYNKPNQTGIYEHFKAIASNTYKPVILYNVPGRTSSNISAETTLKLANEFENIVAVKEASGNFGQIMSIVKNKPEGFIVLSGDDATTLPLISVGIEGVISVVANAYPAEFSEMVRLSLKGDYEKARTIHYQLVDIIDSLFEEGNPAGVKAHLTKMGIIKNKLRLPLVPVSDSLMRRIEKLSIKDK